MGQSRLPEPAWVARINALLPQTQCTRCGEPDCASYASVIAAGAPINRCPPGGEEGVQRLAALTGRPPEPIDPACGQEGPRSVAWIDETVCIGCTLCIKACPVDCIVGAPKRMHTVIEDWCTGCELCLPACPVDCIHLDIATPGASGWAAWSEVQASEARQRYDTRRQRLASAGEETSQRLAEQALPTPHAVTGASDSPPDRDAKQVAIAAALALARARRGL